MIFLFTLIEIIHEACEYKNCRNEGTSNNNDVFIPHFSLSLESLRFIIFSMNQLTIFYRFFFSPRLSESLSRRAASGAEHNYLLHERYLIESFETVFVATLRRCCVSCTSAVSNIEATMTSKFFCQSSWSLDSILINFLHDSQQY